MEGRVLLVGGGGYVGCVLSEELLAKGYSVRILDRMFFGKRPLENLLDRVELVVEDMRHMKEEHFEGCSSVILLGGLSNDPTAEFNPKANHELNTVATVRAAEMAKRLGVPRLVFASTCSIYDRGLEDPSRDLILNEDSDVAPRAAYATSKLAAERQILALNDASFTTMAFRKGTVFGFSPRMRYDLVMNSFVKDALSKGVIEIHNGGEMWRPLIDIRDVARAYLMAIEADAGLIGGRVFNLSAGNFRISELALRVQNALSGMGVTTVIVPDYTYRLVRTYRVSCEKVERTLGFRPRVTVEESVARMVAEIRQWGYTDFSNPRYYNIEWMKLLEESVDIVSAFGYVLSEPSQMPGVVRVPDLALG